MGDNMGKYLVFILLLYALFLYPSDRAELDVYANNLTSMSLEINESNLDFGNIDPSKKEIMEFNAVRMTVKSNVKWVLYLEAEDNLVSLTGDMIPINRLLFKSLNKDFTPLKLNRPVIIASGDPTDEDGEEIILDFKLKLKWTDIAGQYHTKLIFDLNTLY